MQKSVKKAGFHSIGATIRTCRESRCLPSPVKLEGGCQAHRVGYFGSAMICKKLLPEIESK